MQEKTDQLTQENGVLITPREAQRQEAINELLQNFFLDQKAETVEEEVWDLFITALEAKSFNHWTRQKRGTCGVTVRNLNSFLRSLQNLGSKEVVHG